MKPKTMVELELERTVEPEPETMVEPEPETMMKLKTMVELELETTVEPEPKTMVEPKLEIMMKPRTMAELELETTVEPEPETMVEPEPETMVELEPETMVEPEPEKMVEPEPETMVESEPETMVEPEPETMVEPVIEREPNTFNEPGNEIYDDSENIDMLLLENLAAVIQGSMNNITSEIRIMESLIPEERQLGNLECQWKSGTHSTRAYNLPSVNDQQFYLTDKAFSKQLYYGRILEAKFACEAWGEECTGFSVSTFQNHTFYQLHRKYVDIDDHDLRAHSSSNINQLWHQFLANTTTLLSAHQTPNNGTGNGTERTSWTVASNTTTEIWFKVCSRNGSSSINTSATATLLRGNSHVMRKRDAEEVPSVTVYEHSKFKGSSAVLTGVVQTIDGPLKNKISSLRLSQKDWSVVVFLEANYLGRQAAFVGDSSFVGSRMDDRISSLIVLPFRLDQLCYTVYEHSYYQGRHQRFCGDQDFTSGSSWNKKISSLRWNKRISSLRVESPDCGLILYDRSYDGKFKMFNGNVPYVGNEWSDKTSSIQIRPWILETYEGQIAPVTLFYEHSYYRGASVAVEGSSEFIGWNMNDEASSVRCDGECALLVFEDSEFKGQSRLYDGSQASMPNFNDKLSSALVLMNKICVTFYEQVLYRGRSRRDCSDVDEFPSNWNDRVSSLKVECSPCSVILYEHGSYRGDYKAFSGNVPWIGGHWNNLITSLQIRPWKLDSYEKKSVKSCVDPGEKKAHGVIQWIPILSSFYNLGTSVYYGAKGCHIVANERAKDMAIDLAIDGVMTMGSIATGGALGAVAFGIKTGVKTGVKAGVKAGVKVGLQAAKKAAAATIRNTLRKAGKSAVKLATRGITGNAKSFGKSVLKNVKAIRNTVKALPSAVKAGAKKVVRGVKKGTTQSVKQTAKEGATKVKNTLKRWGNDLAKSGSSQIDEARAAKKSGYAKMSESGNVKTSESGNVEKNLCRIKRGNYFSNQCSNPDDTKRKSEKEAKKNSKPEAEENSEREAKEKAAVKRREKNKRKREKQKERKRKRKEEEEEKRRQEEANGRRQETNENVNEHEWEEEEKRRQEEANGRRQETNENVNEHEWENVIQKSTKKKKRQKAKRKEGRSRLHRAQDRSMNSPERRSRAEVFFYSLKAIEERETI